ncbi:MAG TPA: LysR family transcriptional regulator [Deltaproteobacteria bacterium]|nr:LysR family transcriptional regulator [Deltaproteobacteria bacterium]
MSNDLLAFPFSLRQLQYAIAVDRHLSFRRAAEVCGVSQPTLSAQLAKLEAHLGVVIFERHTRRVLTTPAGRELLDRIGPLVEGARDLADAGRALSDPDRVTLRIGVMPTLAPYLLPAAHHHLRRDPPLPRIHWLELQTAACEARLSSGELDAMIIADEPSQPSVDHVELGFEPFWAVLPPGSSAGSAIDLPELARWDLLLLDDGHCLRDHAMSFCMLPSVRESPFRATSLPTLVQMVASGYGASVLPALALAHETARAEVVSRPFADPRIGRTLRMGWRARSPHTRQMRRAAGRIRTAIAQALEIACAIWPQGPGGDHVLEQVSWPIGGE